MAGAAIAAGQAIARLQNSSGGGRAFVKIPHELRNYERSVDYACFWQCTGCGFQVEVSAPKPTTGAYRAMPEVPHTDRRRVECCEHCGEVAWANLREGGVVEALIEQDAARQSSRGQRRSGLFKLVSIVGWGLIAAMTARSGDGSALFYPLAAATLAVFLHGAYREFNNGKRAATPNSWSFAPEPKGRRRGGLEGRLSARQLLRAPLSGRACVAYELGVRPDSNAEDETWSWTLLEQRTAELEVGGQRLGATPHLKLRRRVYADELSEGAEVELRKRGIDPKRPGYTFFETVVLADEYGVVTQRKDGCTLARG